MGHAGGLVAQRGHVAGGPFPHVVPVVLLSGALGGGRRPVRSICAPRRGGTATRRCGAGSQARGGVAQAGRPQAARAVVMCLSLLLCAVLLVWADVDEVRNG